MKAFLKIATTAAAVSAAAMFASVPARAADISISFGGIGYSSDSGGYCDQYGCPDDYWDYPVSYCPVYYKGDWYQGPVYYETRGGENWFWVRGAWHRESNFGRRPSWACQDRYGPPLGLDFYISHGFRVRDNWRQQWSRDQGNWNRSRQNWYGSHSNWNDKNQPDWYRAQGRNNSSGNGHGNNDNGHGNNGSPNGNMSGPNGNDHNGNGLGNGQGNGQGGDHRGRGDRGTTQGGTMGGPSGNSGGTAPGTHNDQNSGSPSGYYQQKLHGMLDKRTGKTGGPATTTTPPATVTPPVVTAPPAAVTPPATPPGKTGGTDKGGHDKGGKGDKTQDGTSTDPSGDKKDHHRPDGT